MQFDAESSRITNVFRELVDVDELGMATRRRVPLDHVTKSLAENHLVQALTEARLLVQSEGENHNALVEVAHEALFRSWPRLTKWLETACDDLRLLRQVKLAAQEWDAHRGEQAYLWPDERLKVVYSMINRFQPSLEEVVKVFIRPEANDYC